VFHLPGGSGGGNFSILRNYAQGEDFILGTDPNEAGQPGSAPPVDETNTTCSGNVATTVVPVEEDIDAMYGRVGIQGKPAVVSIDPADTDGLMRVRAKSPTFDWTIGDDVAAPARRALVDTTDKCLKCHVGSMYQHGGNRVDNVDLCLLCHNTAANEAFVRDGFGVDESEAYDGRSGQNFGMREMLHAVHSAGETEAPIVIYRGRGIYAWADNVGQLPNWPTEPDCVYGNNDSPGNIVFGSDADTATERLCQPHNFHTPTYPRELNDCAACHVEDFAVMPDATKAMASTVETGDPPFGDRLNDVLEGITASSCMTCHRSGDPAVESALKAHAYQNGWTPQAFEEGRQTIIDAVK
jgi:OmcA/MtrC family decaheme c-type cytochrome